ncbi:GIY-YIG nuclease family protein [Varibaculum cambriense]|uniref:Methionine sulfoxide reductase n=2 Tax=Varibaculum cambriense TaxID=184870 RepID=A0ABX4US69_9ACTO|nr:GIY-YIG nuclease family protein [Varibaculum cambriense]PMB91096.1 methionine sulfoxide reductase [Varibaculum cambriense]
MAGKSINLFLMDGKPTGRIKGTLANWTGLAYKIPRTKLEQARNIPFLQQSGVYLLFGISNETGDPAVYIGQAGIRKNGQGILNRWEEHKRDNRKDWWTEAVAFTTSNNSFGPTEISYLENRFRNMAISADRYLVMNGIEPTLGNLTEEKESEMEEYISYALLVIGALGYKVFEPLISGLEKSVPPEETEDEPLLFFRSKRAEASAQRTAEGFVVRAGSRISLEMAKSIPKNAIRLRKRYAESISSDGVVSKNLLFASPSAAASFVGGSSLSGNVVWKTAEGRTIRDLDS